MATTPPVLNPSPRTRFQQSSTRISAHRQMVQSPEFEHAADAALLQYHVDLAGGLRDVNSAAAIGLKLTGAQEFLTVFKLLAEQPPRAPAPPARDTLDANA